MQAHAGRCHGLGISDEALAALGTGDEREGRGHVVPVGACARRVLLAQGIQAEAVSAGSCLNVAAVARILADDLHGLQHVQSRTVVALGERRVNVGESGHRHGAYDTAPLAPMVTSSTACDRPPSRSKPPALWPQAQPHHPAVRRPPTSLSASHTQDAMLHTSHCYVIIRWQFNTTPSRLGNSTIVSH